MKDKFENRIKFWNTKFKKYTKQEILNFERKYNLILPKDYRDLLQNYGKVEHTKYWYYYKSKNDESEYLLNSSISIDDHDISIEFFWKPLTNTNPHLSRKHYLPIFSTHSPNFFFLIGLDDSNRGKIFEYDSDYEDFEPRECANSFYEFFQEKIYCTLSMHSKAECGAIEIFRHNGVEIWEITDKNFSIDKPGKTYRLNFWVQSEMKYIHKLEDTGDTDVMFELKIPLDSIPNFENPWIYNYPGYKSVEHDFGEWEQSCWDNFFYYGHESLEDIKLTIVRDIEGNYFVQVTGERDDPINWVNGKAKYRITVKTILNNKMNSYWMNE